MLYLPMKYVRPGMILAREALYNIGRLPLLMPGQPLTEAYLQRLESCGVAGVYVENGFSDGIEVQEVLSPEFKRKALVETKGVLDDYVRTHSIASSALRSVSGIAQNMVVHVLGREEVMLNVVDVKDYDNYTYTHSMYVGLLSCMIGLRMGCTRTALTELATAGLLHDIGKLDISPDIVNKPSKLTDEEFEVMKTHPTNAANRLVPCCQLSYKTIQGILSHHERFDGTGYPRGLRGKDIPLYGRILALADVYDALTSERPYRKAMFSGNAIEYIMSGANTHFDFEVLQAFMKTVAPYPTGALVQLSDGEIAIVLRNSAANVLRPSVRLITGQPGKEINLCADMAYLNVTIQGLLDEKTPLPEDFLAGAAQNE